MICEMIDQLGIERPNLLNTSHYYSNSSKINIIEEFFTDGLDYRGLGKY